MKYIIILLFTFSNAVAQIPSYPVAQITNNYSSVNVTTSAWTQLVASTSQSIKKLEIFDSSGQTLQIGVGAAGSEVSQIYIIPGGNGVISIGIPQGSRISIKAVSANATAGNLYINAYN